MFTINIYLRFALIVVGLIAGIGLWAAYGFWYGFPFLLIGIFALIGYLMLGTIMSTNMLLSQARFHEAEQRLKLTFFPGILLVGYKGVYYMTHGALALQSKDLVTAETWLKKALDAGLPSDNERGAALLQLAMILASKNNRQAAQKHLAEIKKLNITENMLKEQVKDLEKQLKQMGQAMNPSMIGMMGRGGGKGGGKRKMPRLR
ncbi:MAG: hypothetical protein EP344_07355 [Bacteroidetes bacterium]|nr:MAG: hypothetical protein EP344_07355 [Bacteroidota bacterium]